LTSAESKPELHLEIAHVLFMDVVGYSKLLINDQSEILEQLNRVVRDTSQFREADAAGKLIRLATGDGMALVFFNNVEAPVKCALEISEALQSYPHIQLRMGVHSGPINPISDVNDRANVTGAGINMAQRVMDCGDTGHILLSRRVAEDLEQYRQWRPYLHDLGEYEVKHGVRVHIFNLCTDRFGNRNVPSKLKSSYARERSKRGLVVVSLTLILLLGLAAGYWMITHHTTKSIRPTAATVSATSFIPEKSIAVLPFENLSEEKANAYFAEGIQEEVLTRLAKIADLKVISRTSTAKYRSAPDNLREIAKQLGVANILEGSVQKTADQVRVNVQLINAQTDSHLWADTYDRKLTDIFGVESEIAKGIAESLQAKLTGGEEQALAVKPTNNPEAYDAYLRGLAFEARHSFVEEDLIGKAIGSYERAVQLDPNFALAWSRLSRANDGFYFDIETNATRRDAAKRALDNAQKLQPNSPDTLLALGAYQFYVLGDYGLAKATFQRVNKILPGNSEALTGLAFIARREGHWDESIAYAEQILVLDPQNTDSLGQAANTYVYLRQFPAALKLYERALDLLPNDPDLMAAKAAVYQAEGNLEEAAKFLPDVNAQTPSSEAFGTKITQLVFERNFGEAVRLQQARLAQSSEFKGVNQVSLALNQRLAGDSAGAKATAEQARNTLEPLCKSQPDNPGRATWLAWAYAVLGNKDAALKEAERATALVPSAKNALWGPSYEESLALLELFLGEKSRAIPTLARLLQTPYHEWNYGTPITPAHLRLDPTWDPLRGDPAFQKLCEEKPH
jgi:TolB-like protein/class 3 adenylate cyclase/Tfp pilus assembly protein PilF